MLKPTKGDVQMAIAILTFPLKLLAMILKAIDKAQEDASRQQRRDVLNYGTMSAAQAREIMNQKRIASMETDRLVQEKLKADIALTKARTAYYETNNAKFGTDAVLPTTEVVRFNTCPNGHNQSINLGNTCQECGKPMTTVQPYVN